MSAVGTAVVCYLQSTAAASKWCIWCRHSHQLLGHTAAVLATVKLYSSSCSSISALSPGYSLPLAFHSRQAHDQHASSWRQGIQRAVHIVRYQLLGPQRETPLLLRFKELQVDSCSRAAYASASSCLLTAACSQPATGVHGVLALPSCAACPLRRCGRVFLQICWCWC